jgi:hypothetical protein
MQVKLFETSWSVDLPKLEDEVNSFLKTLNPGAVKHVQTAMAASRTDSDQGETDYLISVWYE